MKTWHPSGKGAGESQTVSVSADGTAEIAVKMDLKRERRQRKPGAVDERDY